ncbi:MAG: GNAT family N-acetyltransferase [Gemmatimonadaceae bacterium]
MLPPPEGIAPTPRIALADDDADIARCFGVLRELRPHLASAHDLVVRVHRQRDDGGYQLAYLEQDGEVLAVAGFRLMECLAWGRILYVDDLVTHGTRHGQGYGQKLMAWLVDRARANDCDQLHLDSGVQRFGAHRFYLASRMNITAHHFAIDLRAR